MTEHKQTAGSIVFQHYSADTREQMELSQLCRTGYYSFHESQNVYTEINCEAGNLSSFQIPTLSTYTVSCSSRRFLFSVAQGPVHDMRWVYQDR